MTFFGLWIKKFRQTKELSLLGLTKTSIRYLNIIVCFIRCNKTSFFNFNVYCFNVVVIKMKKKTLYPLGEALWHLKWHNTLDLFHLHNFKNHFLLQWPFIKPVPQEYFALISLRDSWVSGTSSKLRTFPIYFLYGMNTSLFKLVFFSLYFTFKASLSTFSVTILFETLIFNLTPPQAQSTNIKWLTK